MKPAAYIATHPVFRFDEFLAEHAREGRRRPAATVSILQQHVAAGNLLRVRRGVYASVPRGVRPEEYQVDPYLVASKLTDDAVVAYHAALQLLGKAHSLSRQLTYLTHHRVRPFEFQGAEFIPVLAPAAVRELPEFGGRIMEMQRHGTRIRVTDHERTAVDVMDSPEHGGGWEEIWRSLGSIEFFDLDAIVAYAQRLGTASTAARVGLFLDQHRERLMVEERHLDALRALAPKQPRYFDGRRAPGRLVPAWNLIVPEEILDRSWEET
jgi:predicted transcriptional regulator of viral defense system